MRRNILIYLSVLAGLSSLMQSQTAVLPPAPSSLPSSSDTGSYVLGPLDLIQVTVFGAPELSTTARVSAAGNVVLPLLGVVAVGGKSVSAATAAISDRYRKAKLLNEPQVEIFIRDVQSQKATVSGAVKTPTLVHMLAPMPLGDVLAQAGGVDPIYGGAEVEITRGARGLALGLPAKSELDLHLSATAGELIYPGDVVRVPEAGVVYVIGSVKKPGGFALAANSNLTVLQALALAQGLDTAADESATVIIRRTPAGQLEIPVQLGQVLQRKAPNLPLQENDILYIPRSGAKNVLDRGLNAVINITSGILIYH